MGSRPQATRRFGSVCRFGYSWPFVLVILALAIRPVGAQELTGMARFDIPSQALQTALLQYSEQAGVQVVVANELVKNLKAPAVRGEYSRPRALSMLLEGSGLAYRVTADRTVAISLEKTSESAPPASADAVASEDRGEGSPRLEEVIVTANKVAEPLNKVPASVGVLTASALDSQHVVDMQDVVNRVPGLSSNFSGAPGTSTFTIRGISPGGGTEATTGLYIDDVSINGGLGFSGAYEPAFFDLDRIEVLRGPQGTLYGADSFGGTIRYVNKQPDLNKLDGELTTSFYGQAQGDPGESVRGAVNLPLIDHTLGLRLAGIYQHDGGFIDHVDSTGAVVQKNSNVQDVYGVRGVLLWQPAEGLKVTPTFQYQTTRNADRWFYDETRGPFDTPKRLEEPTHDRFLFSAVNVEANFGSSSLTSVSSYVDRKPSAVRDFTVYDNSGYIAPTVAAFFDPSDAKNSLQALSDIAVPAYHPETNQQWAQEIRLASHFDGIGLRTLFGLYFNHEVRGHNAYEVAAGFGRLTQALFGVSTDEALTQAFDLQPGQADLGDTFFVEDTQERINREAVYGEASWTPPSERLQGLTLTLGTRVSKITYRFTGFYDGFFTEGYTPINHAFDENQVAPKYRIAYQATDTLLLYASAAKGFRLGGTNQPLPSTCDAEVQSSGTTPGDTYATDSIWSYEAGTKVSLFDRTVQLNASAFHIDWNKIAEQVNFQSCGFGFQANVGAATSDGGDISIELRPISALDIQLGVAYTDSQFSKTIAEDNVFKGSPVPFSPSWTASINVGYTWRIRAGNAYLRANYNYTDVSRGGLIVSQGNFIRPSYDTVGVSGGYERDGWDVSVYAKNLTNAHPRLQEEIFTGYSNISTLRPRQVGVEISKSF